jgi:ribonuclease E
MIMPSHAKNVKHYQDAMPLFARHQVESYLSGMFNPTVQLKSGGYIVIGVTEALVAIDVNSGRATKEGSIEETALKTNLEAAEEVARQLRLRDLAGLIVIDFIDMDERKNNAAVEKRMKDKLKTDRARIQVGRISGFGLMEMSRQRLRPGMIEATTQPCPACHGTGLIRSDDNLALSILRQIEEEGVRGRSREVLVKCPVGIANFLMNQKREHVAQIEARYGLSVRIEGDPLLISPDFNIEKFKTATRNVPVAAAPVVSVDSSLMDDIDNSAEEPAEAKSDNTAENADNNGEEGKPKKRRRRRRRRSKSKSGEEGQNGEAQNANDGDKPSKAKGETTQVAETVEAKADAPSGENAEEKPSEDKPKKVTRSRSRAKAKAKTDEAKGEAAEAEKTEAKADAADDSAETGDAKAEKPKRTRKPRSTAKKPKADNSKDDTKPEAPKEEVKAEASPKTASEPARAAQAAPEPTAPAPEAPKEAATASAGATEANEAEPPKPKKRGWWSLGR